MINLCFLIRAVIAKIFNSTAELAIPTEIPTNEANAEIETHPLKQKRNQGNAQSSSKPFTSFYAYCLWSFLLKDTFLFHLIC